MRTIKFKAKRLDNREWVKGDLAHSLDGGLNIFGFTRENGVDGYSGVHLIDPKTVCQFTGLKDCEGKEVWEGDIVEHEIWNRLYDGFIKAKGIIEYKGYEFVVVTNSETYSLYSKRIKVIGNKFDKEK